MTADDFLLLLSSSSFDNVATNSAAIQRTLSGRLRHTAASYMLRKFGGGQSRQEPAILDRQLQISDREDIWMLNILILPLNFPQNREFPAPDFVFLEENYPPRRKLSDMLKLGEGSKLDNCPPAMTPLTPHKPWSTCSIILPAVRRRKLV